MKRNLLVFGMILSVGLITSCGDDDSDGPVVSPIVGEWELDDVSISNVPSGYLLATQATLNNYYGESEYKIVFFEDFTYEREIEFATQSWEDEGEWELDEQDLDLDQDDTNVQGLPTSFTIEGEITDRSMTLVTEDLWLAWPPEIVDDPNTPLDTLEQSELANFFAEYGALVNMTLTIDFDRQ
ncbi:MAG: DUF5004 domain-containing protein [Bacteroidota bacterium]